jgi:uncharacterized lipoprotein
MYLKKKLVMIVVTSAIVLSGCATTLPVNYSPSSTMTASGAVAVVPFTYLPATTGKVEPNQIRNTALGSAMFDQNIDVLIRDAVFKELRFVGIGVNNQETKLSGEIQEFLIDDFGYSVDWTLRVKYIVTDSSGTTYESVKETKRNTNKFVNVFGSLNETIKLNVEDLLKDPAFINSIQ